MPCPRQIDDANIGNCEFDGAIIAVRVQIAGNRGSQTVVVNLSAPTRELPVPFHRIVNLPLIDADLPAGKYTRTITGITAGGGEIDMPIFEDVLLVRDLRLPTGGPAPSSGSLGTKTRCELRLYRRVELFLPDGLHC